MGFNPFAGGKIEQIVPLGANALVNQGGIGLVKGNQLQQVFPDVKPNGLYRVRAGEDGEQQIQVGYNVPWSQHHAWMEWMLGYATTLPVPKQAGGGDGELLPGFPFGGAVLQNNVTEYYLSRAIPYACPVTGKEHLYCTHIEGNDPKGIVLADPNVFMHDAFGNVAKDANGVGIPDLWPMFVEQGTNDDGILPCVATFSALDYEVRTDLETSVLNQQTQAGEMERYVSVEPRAALQSLPLPSGQLFFSNQLSPSQGGGVVAKDNDGSVGAAIPTNALNLLLPTDELLYTWHEVPDQPYAAIQACMGYINAAAFDGARGRFTYPAGTLLCQAPLRRKRYRHLTGRWYWTITYSLLFRPQGWNYLPSAHGNFLLVSSAVDANNNPVGRLLYPSADFTQLFVVPAPLAPVAGFPGG